MATSHMQQEQAGGTQPGTPALRTSKVARTGHPPWDAQRLQAPAQPAHHDDGHDGAVLALQLPPHLPALPLRGVCRRQQEMRGGGAQAGCGG